MPKRQLRVVVSRCIGFEACRWDGGIVESSVARSLSDQAGVVTAYPEAEVGLGVPRFPLELFDVGREVRAVQVGTGRDVTDDLKRHARKTLSTLGSVDAFVLKARSPGCGLGTTKLHDPRHKFVCLASGVFAGEARRRYPDAVFLDEERLAALGLEWLLRLLGA